MKLARMWETGSGRYACQILEVPAGALYRRGGRYEIRDELAVEIVASLRGIVGVEAAAHKLQALARRHDNAIDILDSEAVTLAILAEEQEKYDTSLIVQEGEEAVEPERSSSEVELDAFLAEKGYTPAQIEVLTPQGKAAIHKDDLDPQEVFRADGTVRKPRRRRPKKPTKPPREGATLRGYRLLAWREDWPKGPGNLQRQYEVGQAVDLEEVHRVQKRWTDRGYRTEVVSLEVHHKATRTVKYTLLTGEPHDPLVCHAKDRHAETGHLVPCDWVGDHLGVHLKKHGLDMKQYRVIYNYQGPATVGRATAALGRAHRMVRRRNDLRLGMFVVTIGGDSEGMVWKLTQRQGDNFTFESLEEDSTGMLLTSSEVFERTKPVGSWTRRLKSELLKQRGEE